MRVCKICNVEKDYKKFTTILKAGKVYHSWTCKPCRNDLLYLNETSRKERKKNRLFNALVSWPVK